MSTSLAAITVRDVDGESVRLGDLVDRPTILIVPRYYGCAPCRAYVRHVSQRQAEVKAAGASALAVSVGAEHQARWLMQEQGIDFPLMLDRDRQVHRALDLPRRWWIGLNPRGWWNYTRAISRGSRQGRIIDPNQVPGLAILTASAEPVWTYRGRALGDYPPLDRVLAELPDAS